MILKNLVKSRSLKLKKNYITSSILDAEVILSNIMKVNREFILLNENKNISKNIRKEYDMAIQRRSEREPVAYILGKKEFWSIDFSVNRSTLIPRPETELLVNKVVDIFKGKKINVLDIGVGSGCILFSILKELNLSKGTGIDISKKTIKIAKNNAKKLNLSKRIKLKISDIDDFCFGKYDLIVSNPPYIPTKDLKKLSPEIRNYEPLIALNGGLDGLDLIKKVIYNSEKLLKKNGILAIEIGNSQYKRVSEILTNNGYSEIAKVYDFNFNVRCIISTR